MFSNIFELNMPLNHTSKHAELTDAQFLLIGKLTVEFSNIEFLLGQVLCRLLITPSFLGRTYTDRMNASALIEKIKNAIDIHRRRYGFSIISEELCSRVLEITSKTARIRLIRNKFAHYCWCRNDDETIFGTGFSSAQIDFKKPDNDCILISNSEIEEMYQAAYKIVELLEDTLKKLPELLENGDLGSKLKFKE